jgi:hypothetical protein
MQTLLFNEDVVVLDREKADRLNQVAAGYFFFSGALFFTWEKRDFGGRGGGFRNFCQIGF